MGLRVNSNEITPKEVYLSRRNFLRLGVLTTSLAATGSAYRWLFEPETERLRRGERLITPSGMPLTDTEPQTSYEKIISYNNFYEFSTYKYGVAKRAQALKLRPWTVDVSGLVARPKVFDIDEILKLAPLEERVYRMRCVEGWSMVIPWVGFPLKALLDRVEPHSTARYVEFETLHNPEVMPNQRPSLWGQVLDWPYKEGLRLDEALHPLTILAVGLYGETLLPQNGAPLRLVVPWKYGFKSVKSIVRIRLLAQRPQTTWNLAQPREYGFYANVNPAVSHPRWSQETERRIGEFWTRKTLPFNGYADQVAHLYTGMDLRVNF